MDQDVIRQKTADFIEQMSLVSFEEAKVGPDSNLFELGVLDSYGLIEVILFVEQEFAVKLLEEDMLSPDLSSVGGISRIVANRLAAKES
jgi:acyl carrier protein